MNHVEAIEHATPSQRAFWEEHKARRARMRSFYSAPSRPFFIQPEPPASESMEIYQYVLDLVAARFGILPKMIEVQPRDPKYVLPRHIVLHLMREQSGLTLMEIGRLARRDHSTVINASDRVKERMCMDVGFCETIGSLARQVQDWIARE